MTNPAELLLSANFFTHDAPICHYYLVTTYPDDIGDSRLVQLIAKGDALAFTDLYRRYSGLVYAVALKILADCEEARDVQQQVF